MKQYLVINIGNSTTNFAVFRNGRIVRKVSLDNAKIKNNIDFRFNVDSIFIGSVNPKVTKIIAASLKKSHAISPYVVSHSTKLLKIKYSPVSSLGIDRLAGVIAAVKKYPVPLVVVDCGTATTFNVINSKKEFIGGAITVGLISARDVLHRQTALLPKVTLSGVRRNAVIAQTTVTSLQSGLLHGFGAMIDSMIDRIQKELRAQKISVIATGGNANLIKPYSKRIQKVDADLTLRGIYLLGILQLKEK